MTNSSVSKRANKKAFHLSNFKSSRKSVKDCCAEHNLPISTLRTWLKTLKPSSPMFQEAKLLDNGISKISNGTPGLSVRVRDSLRLDFKDISNPIPIVNLLRELE